VIPVKGFVPAAFHPTLRAGTLFGVPVTRETYKDVLYDYEGSFYRPSGLRADGPETRLTYRCNLCDTRRTVPGSRVPLYLREPGHCDHELRKTGEVVRVLQRDGTIAWRRPWLLRPGDRVYTSQMGINDAGSGKPRGTFRITLCRSQEEEIAQETAARVVPAARGRMPVAARKAARRTAR